MALPIARSDVYIFNAADKRFNSMPSYIFDYDSVVSVSAGRWFFIYVSGNEFEQIN